VSAITQMIETLEPDSMTPKQALTFLYDLKSTWDKNR